MGDYSEQTLVLKDYDLEIPQSCAECLIWSYCFTINAKRNGLLPKNCRENFCPIVEEV